MRPLPSEAQYRLEALVQRRRQLVEMREAEKNRLERAEEAVTPSLNEHIRHLSEQIEEVERELGELIESSPAWQVQEDLLCSVPGIGETTARVLLARLPELGKANREEIAKLVAGPLVGLAPIAQESGTWKGNRHIEGGRADVRRALYMATLTWQPSRACSITTGSDPSMSASLIEEKKQRLCRSGVELPKLS